MNDCPVCGYPHPPGGLHHTPDSWYRATLPAPGTGHTHPERDVDWTPIRHPDCPVCQHEAAQWRSWIDHEDIRGPRGRHRARRVARAAARRTWDGIRAAGRGLVTLLGAALDEL